MVVLGGGAVSYERGNPVMTNHTAGFGTDFARKSSGGGGHVIPERWMRFVLRILVYLVIYDSG